MKSWSHAEDVEGAHVGHILTGLRSTISVCAAFRSSSNQHRVLVKPTMQLNSFCPIELEPPCFEAFLSPAGSISR